jgi:hypothetical protein
MNNPDRSPRQQAEHADQQLVGAVRRYVQQLQAFYVHAGVFAGGMTIIFLVNLATNAAAGNAGDWRAWWSAWAFIGWGLGIAVHGLAVRLNRPTVSSTWEQRHIDKVLTR